MEPKFQAVSLGKLGFFEEELQVKLPESEIFALVDHDHSKRVIRGARQNNLDTMDIAIPAGELVVVTGPGDAAQ